MRSNIGTAAVRDAAPIEKAKVVPDYTVAEAEDATQWEAHLARHPRHNLFTSWGWGDYKARLGWTVRRLLVRNKGGDCVAMAQVQTKGRFGLKAVYVHGGPLFFTDDDVVVERAFKALLAFVDPGWLGLVIVSYERFDTPAALMGTLACGLTPALSRSQHTIVLDTARGLETVRKKLRRFWSRQLNKALADPDVTASYAEDPVERQEAFDALAGMYSSLATRKGFEMAIVPEAFRDFAIADERFVFVVVRRKQEIVAVRIAHGAADRLVDHVAASASETGADGVNHLAIWRLVEYAARTGQPFDFCGIDPVANPGVFNSKRGVSGEAVQSGPFWLHGRNRLLQAAAQVMLALR